MMGEGRKRCATESEGGMEASFGEEALGCEGGEGGKSGGGSRRHLTSYASCLTRKLCKHMGGSILAVR